jgi:hypothetical protein
VLVELGFVTNPGDRTRMVSNPEYYAGIIHRGLRTHFSSWTRMDVASLVPQEFESMRVGNEGAVMVTVPGARGTPLRRLDPGTIVRPVDRANGWYEIRFWNPGLIGWVSEESLEPLSRMASQTTSPAERGRL